jgi:lipoprotein-anchoring transpeptidase ErfK/SrfK
MKSQTSPHLVLIGGLIPLLSVGTSFAGPRALSPEHESIARLQVFLDNRGFRPGVIDGKWGEFTGKALAAYNRAQGIEGSHPDGKPPKDLPFSETDEVFTTGTVTEDDFANIGPVPATLDGKEKEKRLPFESIAELVSERFHCHPNFLRELNPDVSFDRLKPGDVIRVPAVSEPFQLPKSDLFKGAGSDQAGKPSTRGDAGNPNQNAEKAHGIRIDTRESVLELLDADGRLVGLYPITPGSERNPAPAGRWKVQSITFMPKFRHDRQMLEEGKRSEEARLLPPGPNSPVGIVWIALNKDGIGLHGTDAPETIGRSSSHGCIRLANWDAADLAMRLKPGLAVNIDTDAE